MTQFQLDDHLSNSSRQEPKPMIRKAVPEDLLQLTDLLTSSFYQRAGWMGWIYPVVKLGIQEDLKQRIKTQKPNYACLTAINSAPKVAVASADHAHQIGSQQTELVAGTLELSERQSWPWQSLSPKYIYLSNLAVRADVRRRGIARALLAHAEQLALGWQIQDIYLHVMEDNVEARKLYRKAGFSLFQAEDSVSSWLGFKARRLLLHKSLRHKLVNRLQSR